MTYRTPRTPTPLFYLGAHVRIRENGIGDDWAGKTGIIDVIQTEYRPIRYAVWLDEPIMRSDGIRFMKIVVIPEDNLELT